MPHSTKYAMVPKPANKGTMRFAALISELRNAYVIKRNLGLGRPSPHPQPT
jgi:hypothetical protein